MDVGHIKSITREILPIALSRFRFLSVEPEPRNRAIAGFARALSSPASGGRGSPEHLSALVVRSRPDPDGFGRLVSTPSDRGGA